MPPLLQASSTDFILNPIVNAATDFISSTWLPAVFLLMVLESACIPVPSEAVMLFAGFSVSNGDLTLITVCRGLKRSRGWASPGLGAPASSGSIGAGPEPSGAHPAKPLRERRWSPLRCCLSFA
jgi:hypothetical protein